MAGQSTDKGCVSNVTSTGRSSGDHEELTESEKEASHCEPIDVDIGENINKVFITMHGVTSSDVSGKLGPVLTSIVGSRRGACGSTVRHWVTCNDYFNGMASTAAGKATSERSES